LMQNLVHFITLVSIAIVHVGAQRPILSQRGCPQGGCRWQGATW